MNRRKEKRQHKRLKQKKRVSLESLQTGIVENSRMVNCSEDGLYFETDQLLRPGADIFIRVEYISEDRRQTYQCHHAKVIWSKRLKNANYAYGYGVKYVEQSDDQESLEENSAKVKELRKYPRIYCGKQATFSLDNKSFNGYISDISRNGCFIENNELLKDRQILDLVIRGSKFSKKNELKVEVVRLSPGGVGVRFKNIIRKTPIKSLWSNFLGSSVKIRSQPAKTAILSAHDVDFTCFRFSRP